MEKKKRMCGTWWYICLWFSPQPHSYTVTDMYWQLTIVYYDGKDFVPEVITFDFKLKSSCVMCYDTHGDHFKNQ